MIPTDVPPTSAKRRKRWIFPIILLIAGPGFYFAMNYFNGDSTINKLKTDLVKAIHDQSGTDFEVLTLKQDNAVGDRAGYGYSGTGRIKPSGETFNVQVWLEPYFNKSGEGSMMHWSLKPVASPSSLNAPSSGRS